MGRREVTAQDPERLPSRDNANAAYKQVVLSIP